LTAPPAFFDPPEGGYYYESLFAYDPLQNAYPFYYSPAFLSSTGCALIDEQTGATLRMVRVG
jgi:hypothetical protein